MKKLNINDIIGVGGCLLVLCVGILHIYGFISAETALIFSIIMTFLSLIFYIKTRKK